uniref:Uncharacterized protein n=2 Tax=Amorphochlora amoebiformis TaxID=1561963 RepID=A0A0H5BLK7_9EUKA|nr:hypothetical protein [Amorphochlora amoebiformis]
MFKSSNILINHYYNKYLRIVNDRIIALMITKYSESSCFSILKFNHFPDIIYENFQNFQLVQKIRVYYQIVIKKLRYYLKINHYFMLYIDLCYLNFTNRLKLVKTQQSYLLYKYNQRILENNEICFTDSYSKVKDLKFHKNYLKNLTMNKMLIKYRIRLYTFLNQDICLEKNSILKQISIDIDKIPVISDSKNSLYFPAYLLFMFLHKYYNIASKNNIIKIRNILNHKKTIKNINDEIKYIPNSYQKKLSKYNIYNYIRDQIVIKILLNTKIIFTINNNKIKKTRMLKLLSTISTLSNVYDINQRAIKILNQSTFESSIDLLYSKLKHIKNSNLYKKNLAKKLLLTTYNKKSLQLIYYSSKPLVQKIKRRKKRKKRKKKRNIRLIFNKRTNREANLIISKKISQKRVYTRWINIMTAKKKEYRNYNSMKIFKPMKKSIRKGIQQTIDLHKKITYMK